MKNLGILLVFICGLLSCKKDPDILSTDNKNNNTGKVELVFMPMAGDTLLYLDSLIDKDGQIFRVTKLKFFVSGIALPRENSSEAEVIDSAGQNIFLVNFPKGGSSFKLNLKATQGDYKGLRLNIGLPRDINHSDPTLAKYPLNLAQNDMYWSWNSGYIFLLAEGNGPDVANNGFHFGIGEDRRIMPFSFGNALSPETPVHIENGKTTRITLKFDFLKLLVNGDGSKYPLSSTSSAMVHGGYNADILSANASNALELVSSEILK